MVTPPLTHRARAARATPSTLTATIPPSNSPPSSAVTGAYGDSEPPESNSGPRREHRAGREPSERQRPHEQPLLVAQHGEHAHERDDDPVDRGHGGVRGAVTWASNNNVEWPEASPSLRSHRRAEWLALPGGHTHRPARLATVLDSETMFDATIPRAGRAGGVHHSSG